MTELTDHLQAMIDRLATTTSDPKWITDELNNAISLADNGVNISEAKTQVVLRTSNITARDYFANSTLQTALKGVDIAQIATDPTALDAMWDQCLTIADAGVAKLKPA